MKLPRRSFIAGVAASIAARNARSQLLTTGAGSGSFASSSGGGGGGGYVAKAVHLSGTALFDIASLIAPADSGFNSGLMWFKFHANPQDQGRMFQLDPNGNFTNNLALVSDQGPSAGYSNLIFEDGAGNSNINPRFVDTGLPIDVWHSLLWSTNTNLPAGQKIAKVYVDDVDQGELPSDTFDAFLMSFNGKEFAFLQDGFGDGYIGDASDCWIAPGQSLLTAGDINVTTRRKFVTAANKPVDLGADGSTPTGTSPAIFFSGDATTYGQPNLGTGGAFTLTGTLTNASTSPSD